MMLDDTLEETPFDCEFGGVGVREEENVGAATVIVGLGPEGEEEGVNVLPGDAELSPVVLTLTVLDGEKAGLTVPTGDTLAVVLLVTQCEARAECVDCHPGDAVEEADARGGEGVVEILGVGLLDTE